MQRMIEDTGLMKESSLPAAFGTPNDVRLFPTTNSAPNSSTRSIPIANAERSVVEIQQDEEEALAEYRDRAMYLRIVHGMKEKHEAATSQVSLKSCLSDTVAKIARTRNSKLVQDEHSGHYLFKKSQTVCDARLGYDNVLPQADSICFAAADEEGVFEMDM